jgi:hypothetical protein
MPAKYILKQETNVIAVVVAAAASSLELDQVLKTYQ